jgi:hypothetical protein
MTGKGQGLRLRNSKIVACIQKSIGLIRICVLIASLETAFCLVCVGPVGGQATGGARNFSVLNTSLNGTSVGNSNASSAALGMDLWLRGNFHFLPEAICRASLCNKGLQEFPLTHCGSSLPTSLFPFLRTSSCLIVARNIHASGFNTRAPNFSQDVSCIVGRLLVKSISIRIEISQKSPPSVILEIMLLL